MTGVPGREAVNVHHRHEEARGAKKIGSIICDRYHRCAGGKCLRAMQRREGAVTCCVDEEIELVGYTTWGGCPGGTAEHAPAEMKRNGAKVAHLAGVERHIGHRSRCSVRTDEKRRLQAHCESRRRLADATVR